MKQLLHYEIKQYGTKQIKIRTLLQQREDMYKTEQAKHAGIFDALEEAASHQFAPPIQKYLHNG